MFRSCLVYQHIVFEKMYLYQKKYFVPQKKVCFWKKIGTVLLLTCVTTNMCLINDDDDISLFFQLKPKKSFPLMKKENREREKEREESET